MNIDKLKEVTTSNLKNSTDEFRRLFHGRGNCYEGLENITIDSIDKTLFVCFFKELISEIENDVVEFLSKLYKEYSYEAVILQRRYLPKSPSETLFGELESEVYAIEDNLKYKLSFLDNQNIGFFGDMSEGRAFIKSIAENKNILNLFSYTSSFSVVAMNANAKQVVNVDMSKRALNIAKENHKINNISTNNVKFLPFNILKSWSKIRKFAPYDIVIIDPPTFQKGSFIASNDYNKLIKKLPELCNQNCTVLATLNAPELDEQFVIDIFSEFAPDFKFVQRLKNSSFYPSSDNSKSLKCLVFES